MVMMKNKWVVIVGGLVVVGVVAGWKVKQYMAVRIPLIEKKQEVGIMDKQETVKVEEKVAEMGPVEYKLEEVANGLYVPWSVVFTSPERMLVTERSGKIRALVNGVLEREPVYVFSEVSTESEEGLMGMALHPDYESNKWVYVSVAYGEGEKLWVKIVRLVDEGERMRVDKVILDKIPAAKYHAGSRLCFGRDGKLYVTTGDATTKEIAQDLGSLGGKILRMNDDGSVPEENPVAGSLVYSYGHRNPQGIDWSPVTGKMYETEHGPSGFDGPGGGDEFNQIKAGANYGWPVVSHERTAVGMEDPLIVWTPAVAPGSGMFYTGEMLPQFANNFLFGGLKGEGIYRVVFDEAGERVVKWERLMDVNVGRVREIVQGPGGEIYFVTSNRDGRGKLRENDDQIYRLVAKN